jgi:hypothetical protein
MVTRMRPNLVLSGRGMKVLWTGVAILALAGCYYMPQLGGGAGVARASIAVGKSTLPGIASVALVVSGPGMETIASTYTVGASTATLTVPAGPARTFTILASTPSVTFRDEVTVDLSPGETKSITLDPVLAASQIIVPDSRNYRLVQVGDMKGTGWTTLVTTTASSTFAPYEVDFDNAGLVYMANEYSSPAIIQMDDISGANSVALAVTPGYVYSIAMDRTNNLLYYVTYGALYRIPVGPAAGSEAAIDLSSVVGVGFSSTGIAVDSDGMLYMVTTSPSAAVLKIDPNVPTLLASYSDPSLISPWDVLVKGGDVYVSDNGDPKIVRLDKNLQFVDSFRGPPTDPFHGPERFIARLNAPITVVDELNGVPGDRIISFGDMTGAGWTTFGSSGSGQDQFELYNYSYPN